MTPLPFAALVLEREPASWQTLPAAVESYVQIVGSYAFVLLLIGLAATSFRVLQPADGGSGWQTLFFLAFVVAVVGYLGVLIGRAPGFLTRLFATLSGETPPPFVLSASMQRVEHVCLTVGGAAAIVTVLLPLLRNLPALRFRRTWAISLLTIKEIVRRRILWVFGLLALLFLFGSWFIDTKPETQLESYVKIIYWMMSVLLLFTASLLASFSIPADIRQLTIHTVVTKPVEKFEIVLGRFLGHLLVMTAALLVMTTVSLAYLLRTISDEAREETQKARVPITGELEFENTESKDKGISVGEEWEYRSYISGPMQGKKTQYAIWTFKDLPASLTTRPDVRCEFTFYIYRTTIGQLDKGVDCTFTVESFRWHHGREAEYQAERRRLRAKPGLTPDQFAAIDEQLALKYGFYRLESKEVRNYHTQAIDLPSGVVRNQLASASELKPRLDFLQRAHKVADLLTRSKAGGIEFDEQPVLAEWQQQHERLAKLQAKAGRNAEEEQELAKLAEEVPSGEFTEADESELRALQDAVSGKAARPPLRVRVNCESRTQFLGMAKYDLYLLDVERPFVLNFYKGVLGIWLLLCLVIGVAVAVSTYCSGSITWVCVVFLLGMGVLLPEVEKTAAGANEGGGPVESMIRLLGRKTLMESLEETTTAKMASGSDEAFRMGLKPVVSLFPDVAQWDFSNLVASGFDVSWSHVALMLVYLLAYLLPWAVLAYYVIKVREIATW